MRFGSRQRRRRRREGLLFLRHFRGAKGDLDRGDSLTPLKLLEQSLSNLRDLARFGIGCHQQASPFAPPSVAFRSAKRRLSLRESSATPLGSKHTLYAHPLRYPPFSNRNPNLSQ